MTRSRKLLIVRLALSLLAGLVLIAIIRSAPAPPVFLVEVKPGQQVLLSNTKESADGLNWVEVTNTGDGFTWMIITEKSHLDSLRGEVIPYDYRQERWWAYEPHLVLEVVDRTVKVYMPPNWIVFPQ